MNDRPTANELLQAVSRFLQDDVVPALDGHLKYQARVAANVAAIVERELACEERHQAGEWSRLAELMEVEVETPPAEGQNRRDQIVQWTERLRERIREGDADSGPWRAAVLAHLNQTVADKLEVAQGPARPAR